MKPILFLTALIITLPAHAQTVSIDVSVDVQQIVIIHDDGTCLSNGSPCEEVQGGLPNIIDY